MIQIHTKIVQIHTQDIPDNKILKTKAPEIDKLENSLSRSTRVLLAQLRAGKSPFLLAWKHKINPTKYVSPLCPLCGTGEHNTTQNTFSIAYIYQQRWRSRICGTTHVRLRGCLKRGGGNWNPSHNNRRWRDEPVPDSSWGRKKKKN